MSAFVPVLTHVQFMRTDYKKRPPVAVGGRPFHSLTIRKSGKAIIIGGGTSLTAEAGALTYMPQDCAYQTETPEEGFMYTMHFYAQAPLMPQPMTTMPAAPLHLESLFAKAVAHYDAHGCDLFTFALAYQILDAARDAFSPAPLPIPRRMRHCKQYLDEHLTDSALRIGTLADMCGVSEVYFRREFKKFYGAAPLAYIKKRRIDMAKMLLDTGLYSVTDVALRCGFESPGYFSTEFRRMEGKSPKEYGNL